MKKIKLTPTISWPPEFEWFDLSPPRSLLHSGEEPQDLRLHIYKIHS